MKALFIGPKFYNYDIAIQNELKRRGYDVDFFTERSTKWFSISHFLTKVHPRFDALYKLYENSIFNAIHVKKYDLFLLIRCEVLSEDFIQAIIQNNLNPQATKVYYSWDSVVNLPNAKILVKYFDRSYTFDASDAKNYSEMSFLPLFYQEEYSKNVHKEANNCKYDLAIIASFSEKRYWAVKKLISSGYKVYHLLYAPR